MRTSRTWWVSAVLLAFASAGPLLGCYATGSGYAQGGEAAPDYYVYEDPPPQIETYPVVVYEGSPHYYVNGRWYRRTPRGWAYYRSEPAPLVSRRPPPRQERREERRDERHEEKKEEKKEERREDRHDEHHGEHHEEHHDDHH